MTRSERPARPASGSWLRAGVTSLAAAALLLTSIPAPAQATGDGDRLARAKLDRPLRAVVDSGDTADQRVIVRAKPGKRDRLREAVEAPGHDIVKELAAGEALVIEIPGDDLLDLAAEPAVARISSDGTVRPSRRPIVMLGHETVDVTIVAVAGREIDVTDDLALHRDIVTAQDGRRIAARVHRGDVDVLARHPAIVSIAVDEPR